MTTTTKAKETGSENWNSEGTKLDQTGSSGKNYKTTRKDGDV